MHISTIDHFSRETASSFINLYQKHLSPRKGFSCAYRVLHRSESCSQYAKRMILEQGLSRAIPLVRQRFRDCRSANETLKARRQRCQVQRLQPLSHRDTLAQADRPGWPDRPQTELKKQSWVAIESSDDEQPEEPTDEQPNEESGQSGQRRRRIFGGSFRKQGVASDKQGSSGYTDCGDWSDCGDCAIVGCDGLDCSGVDCSFAHCHALDCSSLDCGGADCGALDCGSLDCGGADCSGADCSGCDVGSCG